MDCETLIGFMEGTKSGTMGMAGLVFGWFGGTIFGAFAIMAVMSRLADRWKPWPAALCITGAVAVWVIGASTAMAWWGSPKPTEELSFTEVYLIHEKGWAKEKVLATRDKLNEGRQLYGQHLKGWARDEMTYWMWTKQRECGVRD